MRCNKKVKKVKKVGRVSKRNKATQAINVLGNEAAIIRGSNSLGHSFG